MYVVNGFEFETEEMAEKAKKEANGIKYIKSQTRMDDPEVVFKLYNKLLDKKLFVTPVGIAFLEELQEYLFTIPFFKHEDIRAIPAPIEEVVKKGRNKKKTEKKAEPEKKVETEEEVTPQKSYRTQFRVALFFAIVFAAIIVGMVAINIINYDETKAIDFENQIINKYENWHNELILREKELDNREAALESEAAELKKEK